MPTPPRADVPCRRLYSLSRLTPRAHTGARSDALADALVDAPADAPLTLFI